MTELHPQKLDQMEHILNTALDAVADTIKDNTGIDVKLSLFATFDNPNDDGAVLCQLVTSLQKPEVQTALENLLYTMRKDGGVKMEVVPGGRADG